MPDHPTTAPETLLAVGNPTQPPQLCTAISHNLPQLGASRKAHGLFPTHNCPSFIIRCNARSVQQVRQPIESPHLWIQTPGPSAMQLAQHTSTRCLRKRGNPGSPGTPSQQLPKMALRHIVPQHEPATGSPGTLSEHHQHSRNIYTPKSALKRRRSLTCAISQCHPSTAQHGYQARRQGAAPVPAQAHQARRHRKRTTAHSGGNASSHRHRHEKTDTPRTARHRCQRGSLRSQGPQRGT